jgi:uncharacterized protein YdhG (YjbR/CyaY superfamily)
VAKFESVDAYIESFPADVQPRLEAVRTAIREALPEARETISYDIPTFTLNDRYAVYFAGWKQHISLYPVPSGDEEFERRLAPFRAGRGTLKFPLDEPIPLDLVGQVASLLATARAGRT